MLISIRPKYLVAEETLGILRHENDGAICASRTRFFEGSGGLTDEKNRHEEKLTEGRVIENVVRPARLERATCGFEVQQILKLKNLQAEKVRLL
jgi:hypothetical protein